MEFETSLRYQQLGEKKPRKAVQMLQVLSQLEGSMESEHINMEPPSFPQVAALLITLWTARGS